MSIVAASKGNLGMGRLNTYTHRFTLTVLSALRRLDQVTRSVMREIVTFKRCQRMSMVVKKCSSQERSKIISRLKIKISSLKLKDIKSKIKIQDHKHAKGTVKEFPSIQGFKIQDTDEEDLKPLDVPKQTDEDKPKPLDFLIQPEEEDPMPLDIIYSHPEIASSSRGTNTRGQVHYGHRSLGPIQKEVVVIKKPYNLVKRTNAALRLRTPKAEVGCSGSGRKRNY
nr:hypothetical protein [Tanacetum cinerariifolium]